MRNLTGLLFVFFVSSAALASDCGDEKSKSYLEKLSEEELILMEDQRDLFGTFVTNGTTFSMAHEGVRGCERTDALAHAKRKCLDLLNAPSLAKVPVVLLEYEKKEGITAWPGGAEWCTYHAKVACEVKWLPEEPNAIVLANSTWKGEADGKHWTVRVDRGKAHFNIEFTCGPDHEPFITGPRGNWDFSKQNGKCWAHKTTDWYRQSTACAQNRSSGQESSTFWASGCYKQRDKMQLGIWPYFGSNESFRVELYLDN